MERKPKALFHQPRELWLPSYSLDDVFQRRLYALLPFWPVRFERTFTGSNASAIEKDAAIAELASILPQLAESTGGDSGKVYNLVKELLAYVGCHVIAGGDEASGKARHAMGGEVLELSYEKIERLTRERDEARREGKIEGADLARSSIADRMRERGFDEATIAEIVTA